MSDQLLFTTRTVTRWSETAGTSSVGTAFAIAGVNPAIAMIAANSMDCILFEVICGLQLSFLYIAAGTLTVGCVAAPSVTLNPDRASQVPG